MHLARAGSRNSTQENLGFSKNVIKSGPLIIGDRGQMLAIIITSGLLVC